MINKNNSLVIIDWDNTLFPTTWVTKNNINLQNNINNLNNSYIQYFNNLDTSISSLLNIIQKVSKVLIVTNAMNDWINICLNVLPKTKKELETIRVVSARKRYQEKTPMDQWKVNTFVEEIGVELPDKALQNIVSIGDAVYEYNALVNLWVNNPNKINRYLKNIKFKEEPTQDILIDQLNTTKTSIHKVIFTHGHLDLQFK